MSSESDRSVSYSNALSLIAKHAVNVNSERVALLAGYGRVCYDKQKTKFPEPGYDQSLRDGFAVGRSTVSSENANIVYRLSGEVPAGRCDDCIVSDGEAYRIMTGALLPLGTVAVVPQEECYLEGRQLFVQRDSLIDPDRYIQRKGSSIAAGTEITSAGQLLLPANIAMLAATGVHELEVYRKPRVSFFCSGSELVGLDKCCRPGQKVSSNRYLLHCMIKAQGAIPIDCGIVRDEREQVRSMFSEIAAGDADIVITTGGLGPGKYDLLEEVFEANGSMLLYRSLGVRPGKSTLFGVIGNKLYFGLPGPPSAVSALFGELIIPAIRKMQGLSQYENVAIDAYLKHDISLRDGDILHIKEGFVFTENDRNHVRFTDHLEAPNCRILLPEGISSYRSGDRVTIHKV